MTRIVKAKHKIDRALGKNLWGRAKSPVEKKNSPPGQHAHLGYKKKSDYGTQLAAKQQLKKYYGNITEKYFRKVYKEAVRRKGDTGENLVGLLEQRLDAIIFRSNFVPTIFAARQFVSHKHVKVNGKAVNIPSYQVKVGDVIEIREKSRQIPIVIEALQTKERGETDYHEIDEKAHTVKLTRIPKLADIPYPVVMEPQLVVEFYSR